MKPLLRTANPLWGIAALNVALHLAFYQNLEYHRDELLYFSQGLHLDWGYASVPPLTGWLAGLVGATLGYSVWAVKLLPALGSGAMVLLVAAISHELGGRNYAQILAGIGVVITPLMLRAFFLFQPVYLDMCFWTLLFYWLVRFLDAASDKYLYAMGITLGLGLLNKYLVALWAVSVLLAFLLTKERQVFARKPLYLAFLVSLLVFLPNIIWQILHDFPVLEHMAALNDSQLVHVSRAGFLADQLLMGYAVLALLGPGLYFLLRSPKYRSVGLAVIFTIGLLFLLRGKSYYTAGVFPVLLAAGAVFWENVLKKPFGKVLLPALMILSILPLLPLGLPIYDAEGMIGYFDRLDKNYGIDEGRRFEDGTIHSLPQDYADMLGWDELTRIVQRAYQQTGNKENVLIYCENYGHAGAVTIIGKKYGLPEPMCFSESFLYWAPDLLDHEIQEFIYVNDELGEDLQRGFADIKEIGRIQNVHAREYGTRVYLCRKPRGDLMAFLKGRIAEETPF
ncbi:ArnT family glycosyltransferase [Persicitalea sp.]|uniref:ArnT family glycosyltransferase n=1 Tax=Persicitalea sp. TaxID=3100273 RepID=UPI003592F3F2